LWSKILVLARLQCVVVKKRWFLAWIDLVVVKNIGFRMAAMRSRKNPLVLAWIDLIGVINIGSSMAAIVVI
jgi:acyl carrier protein phosphodiesterase